MQTDRIRKFIFDTVSKHGPLNSHGEVAWVLFLAKGLRIKLPVALSKIASNFDSSVCALLSLDLRERGLITGKLDESRWRAAMDPAGLMSSHWLLSYELALKGWIKGASTRYLDDDGYFSVMKSKNISFYDVNRNVDKLGKTMEKLKKKYLRIYNLIPGQAFRSI